MMDELFSIEGKVALVTGGTSGIGLMIARALARRGAITHIAGRDGARCAQITAELSATGSSTGLVADLADARGPEELARQFAARSQRLDVLINNAGATDRGAIGTITAEQWDAVLDVNLRAAFLLVQQLLPQLRAAGTAAHPARIINIGSIGGLHVPNWESFPYGASKAALHHLTRALCKRLGREHIVVNAIAPGPFPSRMNDTASTAMQDNIRTHVPLGRAGTPEDIEGLVVFLASRAGAYVNGTTIPLDGGYLAAL